MKKLKRAICIVLCFMLNSGLFSGLTPALAGNVPSSGWSAGSAGSVTADLYAAAYGSGLYIAVGAGGTILTTADLSDTWTDRTSGAVTTSTLYGVTCGMDGDGQTLYAAVGAGGTILTSADGTGWTLMSPSTAITEDLRAVTYGCGQFIAVGDAGTVVVSADGTTWRTVSDPDIASIDFTGVACGLNTVSDPVCVAVGGAYIAFSGDGENWDSDVLSDATGLSGAAYYECSAGDPLFIAASSAANSTQYSNYANGSSDWTVASSSPELTGIAAGGGMFIGVGGSNAYFSSDGENWTSVSTGTGFTLNGAAYGENYFVAVGSGGTIVYCAGDQETASITDVSDVADDGDAGDLQVTFERAADETNILEYRIMVVEYDSAADFNLSAANGLTSDYYAAVAPGAYPPGAITLTLPDTLLDTDGYDIADYSYYVFILSVTSGTNKLSEPSEKVTLTTVSWEWANPQPQGNDLNGVAYGDGLYVAVGDSGTILTSPDGTVWTNRQTNSLIEGYSINAVAYGKGRFVAASGGIFSAYTLFSDDGIHWTVHEIDDISGEMYGITYGNGLFVGVSSDGEIATSPDGISWTLRATYPTQFNAVSYSPTGGFTASAFNGKAYVSPDGLSWTALTPYSGEINLYGAYSDGSTIIAVGYNNSGEYSILNYSIDADTWSSLNGTAPDGLFGLVRGSGRYLAVGNSGGVYTSNNGTAWTEQSSGVGTTLSGAVYGDSLFVVVGASGTILTSADGTVWTNRTSGSSVGNIFGMTFGNNSFVAVGDNTIITSDDGISWSASSGIPFVNEEGWTLKGVALGEDASGSDLYAAVGYYYVFDFVHFSIDSYGIIMTSPDAETWTVTETLDASTELQAITYGGGQFVAVGRSGLILTSADGSTWSAQDSDTAENLLGVTYGNDEIYLAVGENLTTVTSTDGINWSAAAITLDPYYLTWDTLFAVTYGNGYFMAVGDQGLVAISSDAVSWDAQGPNFSSPLYALAYGNGMFLTGGQPGGLFSVSDSYLGGSMHSYWEKTAEYTARSNRFYAAAYGDGVYVAAGDSGMVLYTGTPTAAPATATAANNTVSVNPSSITVGNSTTITAAGDKQSAAGAVAGDERYIPTTWTSTEAGMSGTFTLSGGVYTSSYTPSSAGSYTVTATFQKQTWDGSAWNDAVGSTDTKTASLTVTSSGGGSSGDNSSTDNTTAKSGSTIVLAVTGNVDKAQFTLTVADLKAIADNGSILQLESHLGIYKLPATEIDFDSISKQYPNIGYKDIKITVAFSIATGNNAILNGSKLVGQPVSITVSLTAGNKVIELDEFTKYVERDLPVPGDAEFTTGVVIEKDGTLRPIPTKTVTTDGKKYAALFSRTNSIYALINKSVSFDDMKEHWAKEPVNDMASRLIVSGIGNNEFAPERDITRAEFAAIVVKALGLKASDSVDFTDVSSGSWYYGAVAAAYKYGIVSGYVDGTFQPDRNITRQEAMAMTARAMNVAGLDAEIADEAATAVLARFIDANNFSAWARQSSAAVISSGLVVGSKGYARPEKNITRAETAVIIRRLLEKAGLI